MKYEIVQLLKEAAPGFVSGGELGRRFGVSRTAVWKYIEELRAEGYSIEASSRRGYSLLSSEDRLNAYEIADKLDTLVVGREVLYFDTLDSTNNYAKKLAAGGCIDGMAIVAGQQTSGRGRLGRNWESPEDKGIYLSVVLRPAMAPAETQMLTLAAAIASVRAIHKATGICTGIKWPNDLVVHGKKVSGILLEMSSEADKINYVILGIGINYSQNIEEFPLELRDRATSLKLAEEMQANGDRKPFERLSVVRSVLRELDLVYRMVLEGKHAEVLDCWRQYSVTLGKEVGFTLKDISYKGTAVDITPDGRLSVDCSDGIRRDLFSGEVSVRGIYGYV